MHEATAIVSAGSQASFFTQKAFGQLVPTPPQIASYLNNATGGQFSYLINSLLLNSGGWFLLVPSQTLRISGTVQDVLKGQ